MQDNSEELTQIIQGLTETKSVKKNKTKTVKQIKYKTNYKINQKKVEKTTKQY